MIDRLYDWIDNRLAFSRGGRAILNKIFPDHWSFLLGEIALYSFIILLATGVFLTLYFVPSAHEVVYSGPYLPLRGVRVSEAYESTVNLSFAVRGGLLMRQMHHWAANIFVGSIVVHMLRVFFTGAFRRPREINWMLGATLLILAIFNGFLGYSLPDDLISGTGIRIAFSITESIPLVGEYLAFFLFGGNYPGNGTIIPRFYVIHVLILPLIIIGLLGAHLGLLVHQKHTQFRSKSAREDNVVGSPLWPTFVAKTTGFLFLITGVTALMGAVFQINPIWEYGPYKPYIVSYAVQPDWYMGWLDGALRVWPAWEIHLPGHMVPNAFFPGVLLPGVTFTLIYLWPFLEAALSRDTREHHLLDRPRDRPKRTALGCAVFAFYFVLFGASATDVLANYLRLTLNEVLWGFRILTIVVPLITYPIAYKICVELRDAPGAWRRKRPNIVVRSEEGGYEAIPADEYPGYVAPDLDPIPVDEVDVLASLAGEPAPEGIYRVPREYR